MPAKRDSQACVRVLREMAHAFSQALEEEDLVHHLLTHVTASLGAWGALLYLLNPDGDELILAGALGLSEGYLQERPVRVAHSQVDRRVLAGEVVVIPDVAHEPGFEHLAARPGAGLHGMVAVPLSVRDRPIGVLRVYADEVTAIYHEDIELLGSLADLGALAMEKIRLQQSLLHIAEALNSSLDLQPMLQRVLEAAVNELGLKAAAIRLLDPKRQVLHLVAAHGLSEAYLAKGEIHVGKSPVDQRALDGETVVLYDVEQETGFEYPQEAVEEGLRSILVVPLTLKDHTVGVMRVYSARPRHFGPVATGFLRSVADLVALGIENAGLYAALQARYEDLKLDLAEWYRFLALG